MKKAFLKILCLGVLACFTLGLFACGESGGSGLKFRLLENGTYEVSDFKGSQTEIVIPAEYKGKPVSAIGQKAFYAADEIHSVEIPDGVERIGAYAFEYCDELMEVSIPDSVVQIGEGAFKSCSYLGEIDLPDDLTSIEKFAFRDCYDLTTITFPESLKSIGDYAFSGCQNLVRITIPEGVEKIGIEAFVGCHKAVSIIIPSTVKTIERCAFYSCKGATWLTIADGVEEIGDRAFINCESLTTVELPKSVKKIDENAFANCKSLTTLTFSDNLEYIAASAFSGCEKLDYTTEGECSYLGNGTNPYFYLVSASKTITQVNINERCKIVGSFSECKNLTSVVLPDGVKTIANNAFSDCVSLTSVVLPNTLTAIGASAFNRCESLKGISLPVGLQSIGNYAFKSCYFLKNISLPDGLKSIGDGVFASCDGLTSISLPNSIEQVGADAFPATVEKTTENGLEFLGNETNPYLCAVKIVSTNGVAIPAQCRLIAKGVLSSVALQNISVKDGNAFFQSIDGNLYSKDGKTLIRYAAARPEAAFTVPFGVTEIQSGAFAGCRSLRRLMIYKNVERIQESAFSNVSSLTVYCKAEQKPSGWANNLFSDSVTVEWNNSSYYLPDGKLYVW